ncbi:hypothetical protein [Candidatus Rhodobacter oscarellae]|uniref:hypothetical protein n=1 Tax=Candidatus Rhodobacter oscarellae TaxID=1675527 RepID=UPI000AB51098|nr:hypothetical protein [Candidatus Rhodobacter lobularis]
MRILFSLLILVFGTHSVSADSARSFTGFRTNTLYGVYTCVEAAKASFGIIGFQAIVDDDYVYGSSRDGSVYASVWCVELANSNLTQAIMTVSMSDSKSDLNFEFAENVFDELNNQMRGRW